MSRLRRGACAERTPRRVWGLKAKKRIVDEGGKREWEPLRPCSESHARFARPNTARARVRTSCGRKSCCQSTCGASPAGALAGGAQVSPACGRCFAASGEMAPVRLAALALLAASAHAAYTDAAMLSGLTEPVFVSFDGAGHTLVSCGAAPRLGVGGWGRTACPAVAPTPPAALRAHTCRWLKRPAKSSSSPAFLETRATCCWTSPAPWPAVRSPAAWRRSPPAPSPGPRYCASGRLPPRPLSSAELRAAAAAAAGGTRSAPII